MNATPTLEELIRMRVVFTVPGMDAVTVQRDLQYSTVAGQALHMDVYTPAGPPAVRPAVILIHGGPVPRLGAKNLGVFVSYGEVLAASGFVAVAFNHRFTAPSRLADAGADVDALLGRVRGDARSLGIDAERLALWAFSGGGPLLAAVLQERPPWLRALVAYYAALDVQELAGMENELTPDERRRFSAVCSLGENARNAPPILVARAGQDFPWLNAGIDRFVRTALEKGATLDLLNHPDGRHGFDILDDDDRSREIIGRTLGFLRSRLVAGG